MAIEWSNDYRTGVAKIDEQHKQLFKMINGIESLIERRVCDGLEVDGLLMFLGSYIKTHFSFEESCMFKHACPSARDNTKAHREFAAFLQNALSKRQADGPDLAGLRELHRFLSDWIVGHICKVDTKLRGCVRR